MSEQDGLVEHFVMVQDAMVAYKRRAEAAEAEVERLRAALHSITLSYDERCGIDHATLARSALEAKP